MATENPNVPDRSNTTIFVGPISEDGTTLTGPLFVINLPDADPGVEGQLYSNAGVLTVSAG